jgi:hypothetical protein
MGICASWAGARYGCLVGQRNEGLFVNVELPVKPRINVLTIGVDDLDRALRFYRGGLGLSTDGIFGEEFEFGAVAFFSLQPGLRLALCGGYSGYFLDPDQHLWEVVWNPQLQPAD